MMAGLSDQDMANLAAYYASLKKYVSGQQNKQSFRK